MAMPPRMLPTATPMWSDRAALATIAISGRLVATARRTSPPSAEPRCSRVASTSVWFDSWMPATQIATAAATNTTRTTARGRCDTVCDVPGRPEGETAHGAARGRVGAGNEPQQHGDRGDPRPGLGRAGRRLALPAVGRRCDPDARRGAQLARGRLEAAPLGGCLAAGHQRRHGGARGLATDEDEAAGARVAAR